MVDTTLTTVADEIQQFWAPQFSQELRERFIMASLVDRTPGGMGMIRQGDTVRVSQVNQLTGELKTVGTDADTFTPEALSLQHIDITIERRAVASLVFDDLVELQSQVSLDNPSVRDAAAHGMNNQINTYLYSKHGPTTEQTSVANIDAAKLTELKQLADQANWPDGDRWLIVDPQYMKDLMDDSVLTSADFGATDRPVIGGQMVLERYGWKIVMDNSSGLLSVNAAAAGVAFAFIPDWLHLVIQQEARVKVSDRHSNDEFKIGFSVDTVLGAALSNDGADKHIIVRTGV